MAKSISDAETKVGQVTSDIEEAESQVVQLKADLKQHQSDRAAAKAAMAEATAIRKPNLYIWLFEVRHSACDVTLVVIVYASEVDHLAPPSFFSSKALVSYNLVGSV